MRRAPLSATGETIDRSRKDYGCAKPVRTSSITRYDYGLCMPAAGGKFLCLRVSVDVTVTVYYSLC